jgi:hypothetical protein
MVFTRTPSTIALPGRTHAAREAHNNDQTLTPEEQSGYVMDGADRCVGLRSKTRRVEENGAFSSKS